MVSHKPTVPGALMHRQTFRHNTHEIKITEKPGPNSVLSGRFVIYFCCGDLIVLYN